MLVALCFAWGLTWPAMRVALAEIPPFSMRSVTLGLGAASLLIVVAAAEARLRARRRRGLAARRRRGRAQHRGLHDAELLRAVDGGHLARRDPVLHDADLGGAVRVARARRTAQRGARDGAGAVRHGNRDPGLSARRAGIPPGLLLAVATGVSWAAGTVYMKWARIAATRSRSRRGSWCRLRARGPDVPLVEGSWHLSQAHAPALFGTIFTGLIGSGLAYFLWFKIIGRLPAMTASLGILARR